MSFEVWAPNAERVRLLLDGVEHPMIPAGSVGWWTADVVWRADADYGYLLGDDEHPLPDPRSRRQPHGVHALSRTVSVEPPAPWCGKELAGTVIYELHLGTFTPGGTLDSAIEKLDYLVELGIDFVELLPVNGFNGLYNWGYDGVLWYAVHEPYGGPEAYVRFVEACHERGLGVIQDVVYNHLGPSGNYLPRFGPYLVSGSRNTWGDTVNLGERAVRDYIIDNALMWLRDYGADGLRLDAVHALVDESSPHLLRELSDRVSALSDELGRPLTLIAESDLNDATMVSADGHAMTAQWDDDYHHAAHVALTGETGGYYADFDSLAALGKVVTGGFFHDGTYSSFRGRDHGAPVDTDVIEAWRLVTFTQDHDQIGNRATGDRLTATLDADGLALAAMLTMLSPFTPMLFMGEEWGAATPWQFFTSHPEPELGRAVAEGRLAEFAALGWDPADVPDPQHPSTFENSKLEWSELDEPHHQRVLTIYRELAALRREHPSLRSERFATARWDERERWFVMERGDLAVVLNFAHEPRAVPLGVSQVLWSSRDDAAVGDGEVRLPARSGAVVRR